MTDYQKYRNLLDGYFEGTLSPTEESALMKRLTTDADLKSEFEFQNDIINTIKDTRRFELKNRLDNIQIKWYHNISNSWKVAATATVITVSTLTAYYLIDRQEDLKNRIDLAQQEMIIEDSTPDLVGIPHMPDIQATEESTDVAKSPSGPVLEAKNTNITTDQAEISTERKVDILAPDVIEDFDEVDDIDMENISNGDINTINPTREDMNSSVEIRSIIHKKYTFHYNFSGGMLTLYGNFEDIPYEILEINSVSGKSFYLKYKDQFYNIVNTTQITPLKPVTNETLINELKIVKENK